MIDKDQVKQALSAHAAIGLLAGALLYLICLTGTLTVFYEEWQRIEQPGAPEMASIEPDAVQTAIGRVLEGEKGKERERSDCRAGGKRLVRVSPASALSAAPAFHSRPYPCRRVRRDARGIVDFGNSRSPAHLSGRIPPARAQQGRRGPCRLA